MADNINNIITNLSYVAEDEGLKKSSALILEQTKQIEKLTQERVELANKQAQLTAKDIEQQRQIAQRIREVDAQIKAKTKTVIQERVANADLNKELVKEIGYLANLEQKMTALKNQRAFASSAQEVRKLTAEIDKLDREMKGLLTTAKSGSGALGSAFQSVLGGLSLGVGAFGAESVVRGLVGFMGEAIDEIEQAEKAAKQLDLALSAVGQQKFFPGIIQEANQLQEAFFNLYDNDEIIAGQTELVKYGKFTRAELSELTKVAIELASRLGTDVPTAANKIVDILAGRGAGTLRDFGLSTKDAKTETERLNLVLVDLKGKLDGSTEAYANTAAGIRKQNQIIIDDTKEKIGEKLLPIYINVLQGINQLLSGEWEEIALSFGRGLDNVAKYTSFTGAATELTKKLWKSIIGSDDPQVKAGVSDDIRKFYGDAYARALEARKAQNERLSNQLSQEEREAQEAAAKEREARAKELAKQEEARRKAEQKKIQDDFLAAQKQFLDEEAKNRLSAQDYELRKLEEHFAQMKAAYLKAGKDIVDLVTLEEEQKQAIRDKYALEDYKKEVERETKRRQAAKEAAQKEGPVTGEFLPGMSGDVSTEGLAPSAFSPEVTANGYKDAADSIKTSNEQIIESFQAVNTVVQAVGQTLNEAYNASIQRLNLETEAQQGRIERAKKYAERGGAELLEIEEARLDKLNQKRQEFAQQQLIINNALALSNAILAVATAAGETGVGAIAAVPAVLAALAAGYALATSLTEPQAFAEGTKSVEGPGTETSDSIPALLSKNERVVKASTSKKFRRILDDIQDEKFSSEEHLLAKIRGGLYGGPALNYKAILESKNTNTTGATDKLLMSVNGKLDEVREAIVDKPVGMMTADERGLHMWYIKMQKAQQRRDNY